MYKTYACFNYVCIQWLTSEIWGDVSVQPKGSMVIHGVYIYISYIYVYTLQRVFPKRGIFFIEHSISPPQSGWEDNNSTGAICYIDSGGMSTP